MPYSWEYWRKEIRSSIRIFWRCAPEEFQADLVDHLLADQLSFDDMWGRLQTRLEALMAVIGRKPPFIIEVGGRFYEVQHLKRPECRMFPAEKPD